MLPGVCDDGLRNSAMGPKIFPVFSVAETGKLMLRKSPASNRPYYPYFKKLQRSHPFRGIRITLKKLRVTWFL